MTLPWPWGSSPVKLITSTCHHVYISWARTDLFEVLAIGSNTISPLSSHQFMIFSKVHKIYIMTSYFILQNKRISRIFFAWHDFAFDSPYPKMVKNVEKTKWAEFLPWVTFSERYLRFPLVYYVIWPKYGCIRVDTWWMTSAISSYVAYGHLVKRRNHSIVAR